ncbi:MAG: PBP1A family penicillin-binding protein [Candidatus Binatia bacterium]
MRRVLLLLGIATLVVGAGAFLWLRSLSGVVVDKFNGRRWDFPSRVYSDAFLIYPGLDLKAAGFAERLRRLGYHAATADAALREGEYRDRPGGLALFLRASPDPAAPAGAQLVRLGLKGDTVTEIRDGRSSEELFSIALEPEIISGLYDTTWEQRREVSLDELPPLLVQAILLTEDRRFYRHHGIDPIGISRATLANVRSGSVVQGGSTLTQQLMKNFFLNEERTLLRKATEAIMALLAERRYTKREILEAYLNEIYLGQNGVQGIFGVWEAARFYFGRPPEALTVSEIALLAGLIRAPNYYSPHRAPERARARRDVILDMLYDEGAITENQYRTALAAPLRPAPARGAANAAPYFVDFLRNELAAGYPAELLTSHGLGIFTSLDAQLQSIAVESVRAGLEQLERKHPALARRPASQRLEAALIALRPQTGGVVALVGGRDYASSQFNRAVQAHRQPGSVFKPLVFLAALDSAQHRGQALTPTTPLLDQPFDWPYDGRHWRPDNYRGRYLGRVTMRTALEQSLNAATARLAKQTGLPAIVDTAQRVGIASPLPEVPSLVLGAAEVTPFEVAQAYAVIANQGLRANARAITKIVDRRGHLVERRPITVERVTSSEAAFIVAHLMKGVLNRGTGQGARERGWTRPAAGKTGTTNDERDAWFAGFTPDLVAVVWVGLDDNEPLGLTGAEAALPIWTEFMRRATAAAPPADFPPPPGVALVWIDPYTGGAATARCPDRILEAFARGQEPTTPCAAHAELIAPTAAEP